MLRYLILFLTFSFFALGCAGEACPGTPRYDGQAAQEDGTKFAQRLDPSTTGVECSSVDTDGDGYCSCTAFVKGRTEALECGCPRLNPGLRWAWEGVPKGYTVRGCQLDRRLNRNMQFNVTGDGNGEGGQ